MNARTSTLLRRVLVALALLAVAGLMLYLGGGPGGPKDDGKTELVIWGAWRGEGWTKALDKFREMHPDIRLVISTAGGRMDEQKLMCAIAGGSPPDVINQDRFSVSGWASREAFLPLDSFLDRDARDPNAPWPIVRAEFYDACWGEAVYQGRVYAIPMNTDDRVLYYNEDLLRREGYMHPDGTVRVPRTWEELEEYALRLTKRDASGRITQIGFIPIYGNSWLYLYGWQNGGEFMSPDGKTCTLNDPKIVRALVWLTGVYDALGGVQQVDAFSSSFQGGELDPFLTGKVALMINGNWMLNAIATYKPDLNFGVAPAPVPQSRLDRAAKDPRVPPYITWCGGFSWAIPARAKQPALAWEFIKWMSSQECTLLMNDAEYRYSRSRGRLYVPGLTANQRINEEVFKRYAPEGERLRDAFRVCMDMMAYSRFRPVTPVGQLLWDEHVRATDQTRYHGKTPIEEAAQEAVQRATAKVQAQLDLLHQKKVYPELPVRRVGLVLAGLVGAAVIVFAAAAWRYVRQRRGPNRREALIGYAFIAPWAFGLAVLTAGPILVSLVLSFCEYDVLHPAKFVGLDNYLALPDDGIFWKSLANTLWMVGAVPLGLAVGLGVALLLNMEVRGQRFYRTVYYLPAIVPIVASSILWLWILHPEFGLINVSLHQFLGLVGPKWLQDEAWSKPALILMGLWSAGAGMIIWLAGLKGIPKELYEAAEIDGAGRLSCFLHITWPMLTPYLFFNLIIGIIGAFQIFTNAYIMTNGEGGPVDSTLFYVFYLFNQAFRYFKMGYASALAWVLFLIVLALTMANWKLRTKWVVTERGDL